MIIKINDGMEVREMDVHDLQIIEYFDLDFKVYSKKRNIFGFRKRLIKSSLNVLMAFAHIMFIFGVRESDIDLVVCKDLHKLKTNNLFRMYA